VTRGYRNGGADYPWKQSGAALFSGGKNYSGTFAESTNNRRWKGSRTATRAAIYAKASAYLGLLLGLVYLISDSGLQKNLIRNTESQESRKRVTVVPAENIACRLLQIRILMRIRGRAATEKA
jgi:hypothetical protein